MTSSTHFPLADLLEPSARMALAAFLHDLGKFAERAAIDVDIETLEAHLQQYCPQQAAGGRQWFTHKHAAFTALAMDLLEPLMPPLKRHDLTPFASLDSREVDDSLINAAARHHKPETFLQWIVATADRVASGFEREEFERYNQAEEGTATGKNHYTARLLPLFEQIRLGEKSGFQRGELKFRYPLRPMSPDALLPVAAEGYETNDREAARKEYRELWNGFMTALELIPPTHRTHLSLWLDHFDTAWACYTHAIPSATAFGMRPDVSLYDHSKTTAALATALWRYHHERGDDWHIATQGMQTRSDWSEQKLLLIQGDFFGIQDFIFASGGETQKRAAKLLRGRSFYVSLITECAALKVLDGLGLPSTSQIINAAGKFLIVAPNTKTVRDTLAQVQNTLNDWFLAHSWGVAGIGLAWLPACGNDFLRRSQQDGQAAPFACLLEALFAQLERVKLQRYGLATAQAPNPVFEGFLDQFHNERGVCRIDDRSPATRQIDDGVWVGDLAWDQIQIGEYLTRHERLLITRCPLERQSRLELPVFGYHIGFTAPQEASGRFGTLARSGDLLRAWDFSLPKTADEPLWNGHARRYINAYIPHFEAIDGATAGKYEAAEGEGTEPFAPDEAKTLSHIACEDRRLKRTDGDRERWLGIQALMTLKGDVDNLGRIFQQGLGRPTFARIAALSRQLNAFFTVYLPWQCQSQPQFRNTYTVFAGGDDFFLIGPWRSQIRLAEAMNRWFHEYVARNPEIHFSAGLAMTKPGLPIRHLGRIAEEALDAAKGYGADPAQQRPPSKNAVCCYGHVVGWNEFDQLMRSLIELERLADEEQLSTGYLYGLLQLADMQQAIDERPENAIWHAWFAYRTRRLLERKRHLGDPRRRELQQILASEIAHKGIERFGARFKISLFTHLYQQRN